MNDESKFHVDGTLAAAERAIELQAENERLRARIAEHELLFGVALHTDDFLEKLLEGLGKQLPPHTPRTIDGIVDAVAALALKVDAHRDASVPAFDEIVQLCGLAKTWEYPGQVIRDVADAIQKRDDRIAALETDVNWLRSVWNTEIGKNNELREQVRIAEAVRDDARRASTIDLEQRRHATDAHMHYAALLAAQEKRVVEIDADRNALLKRRDELLQTIARLSNTVPFPDEWKDWEGQRAKLIAEVGTMRNRVATLEAIAKEDHLTAIKRNGAMLDKISRLESDKEIAYSERDRCVAAIASLAFLRLGWDAWLGKHEPDPKWDQDWMNIVFIELPTGQVSWHIHDSELSWFSFLPGPLTRAWDGHTTPEKYQRLAAISKIPPLHSRECGTRYRGCAPDCAFDAEQNATAVKALYMSSSHNPPLAVACPRCEVPAGELCDDKPSDVWATGMVHVERANLIGADLKPLSGGPTLGGEDLSSDPAIRRAQIEAVVMGEPICGCSLKYRELAPGVHAKYCQLAGQPL